MTTSASTQPSRSPEGAVDFDQLSRQLGGDDTMVACLAQLFVQEVPRRLSDLQAALESSDQERARRAAHAIKGSALQLAAPAAARAALEVEARAKAGDLTGAASGYGTLSAEVERAVQVFATLVEGGST